MDYTTILGLQPNSDPRKLVFLFTSIIISSSLMVGKICRGFPSFILLFNKLISTGNFKDFLG